MTADVTNINDCVVLHSVLVAFAPPIQIQADLDLAPTAESNFCQRVFGRRVFTAVSARCRPPAENEDAFDIEKHDEEENYGNGTHAKIMGAPPPAGSKIRYAPVNTLNVFCRDFADT